MILDTLWKILFFKKAVWFFHHPRWPPPLVWQKTILFPIFFWDLSLPSCWTWTWRARPTPPWSQCTANRPFLIDKEPIFDHPVLLEHAELAQHLLVIWIQIHIAFFGKAWTLPSSSFLPSNTLLYLYLYLYLYLCLYLYLHQYLYLYLYLYLYFVLSFIFLSPLLLLDCDDDNVQILPKYHSNFEQHSVLVFGFFEQIWIVCAL